MRGERRTDCGSLYVHFIIKTEICEHNHCVCGSPPYTGVYIFRHRNTVSVQEREQKQLDSKKLTAKIKNKETGEVKLKTKHM